MNPFRMRFLLWMVFIISGQIFDFTFKNHMRNELGWTIYYASAATVDWFLLKSVSKFVSGNLRRDMEIFCIISIFINCVGWVMYLSYAPPYLYNKSISVVNYAIAIRLIFMGGGDVPNYLDWRNMVSCFNNRRYNWSTEKEK